MTLHCGVSYVAARCPSVVQPELERALGTDVPGTPARQLTARRASSSHPNQRLAALRRENRAEVDRPGLAVQKIEQGQRSSGAPASLRWGGEGRGSAVIWGCKRSRPRGRPGAPVVLASRRPCEHGRRERVFPSSAGSTHRPLPIPVNV
jgi:hypothetical protein